jgi:thioredoxin-dependent peroxiredoxin
MADEMKASTPVSAGSPAPDFSLPARSGKTISLRDYRGSKDVLIYFYPKDDTPGCTRESCSLRDSWGELQGAGIEVLGISRDDSASHSAFAAKYNLPFELLTDADHAVHEAYGAWGQNPNPAWGVGPLRKSFLVGKDGRIRQVFDKVDTEHHAEQVLKAAGVAVAPKPAPAPKPAAPAAAAPAPAPKPAAPPASKPAAPPAPKPPAPPAPKPAAPPAPKPPAPPAPKPAAPAAKASPKKKAAPKKKKVAAKKKAAKKKTAKKSSPKRKAARKSAPKRKPAKKSAPKKKKAAKKSRKPAKKSAKRKKR